MPKKKIETKITDTMVEKPADLTPEQALNRDWPNKHKELAVYITEKGAIRTGLKPSQVREAEKIRKSYGFGE